MMFITLQSDYHPRRPRLLKFHVMHRLLSLVILVSCSLPAPAQRRGGQNPDAPGTTQGPLRDVRYRSIGPFRGGRVTAVAGIPSQPQTYYFGATGGGIWKTT